MSMGDIYHLIMKNRSYRRFDHSKKLGQIYFKALIDITRKSQSAANLQPLKYISVSLPENIDKLYPCMRWAGYLSDWDGPVESERPVGYVIVLAEKENAKFVQVDAGLAMQNMCLFAMAGGVGSCMIGNMDKNKIREILEIDEKYDIIYAIAFGHPVEKVLLDDFEGDVKYFRDENQVHHVPKRSLKDVLIKQY